MYKSAIQPGLRTACCNISSDKGLLTAFATTWLLLSPPHTLSVLLKISSLLYDNNYPAFVAFQSVCRMCRKSSEEVLFRKITVTVVRSVEKASFDDIIASRRSAGCATRYIRLLPPTSNPFVVDAITATLDPCRDYLTDVQEIV